MKNFFLKTGLTLLCLIIGLGSAWGETASVELCTSWSATFAYTSSYTHDYTIDNLNGGTTTLTLGVQGVYRQSNSNTYFQMNKKSGYFKNTTKLPGKIKKIETTWSAAKGATKCYFAENAQATSSDATVTVTAATSVTYTPPTDADYYYFNIDPSTGSGSAQMTSCIVYYESVSAATPHTVTFDASSNGSCSTSSLTEASAGAGVTLPSCTANTNYTFVGWSTSSTPTSADAGTAGANYKPSADCTLYAYYTYQAPSHTAHFSINGTVDNLKDCTVPEGEAITFPSGLADINGKKFVGWVTSTIDGTTNTEPSFVTSANMGTADVTYYAVYATLTGSGEPSYEKLTSNSFDTNATYVLAAAESSSSTTLHYFSSYTTTTANESWGVTSTTPADAITFTLSGSAAALKAMDGTGAYLTALATGKFRMTGSSKTLNLHDDGTIYNPESGSAGYNLRYNHNNGSGGFRWYNGSTGTSAYFYKVTSGATYSAYCTNVSAPTKTLTSIEVTGTPAEFWKGDEFNHNGMTVTANYDDESTEDVTSAATFSGYDKTIAGQQTVTVTYQEKTATYTINVQTIANTQETAYTVAKAKALIDAGKDLSTEVYVAGTISEIVTAFSSQYGNISFNVSEDGTTTGQQFQFFRNFKGAEKLKWTDENEAPKVGGQVVGYGKLTKFNDIYELAEGNYLVSYSYTPPTTDFIKTPTATVNVLDAIDIKDYINGEYTSYEISTSIDGKTQKDYEFVCIYDQIRFCKAGTYVVDVTGTSGSDTQNGTVTFTVTPSDAELTSVTIGGTLTKTTYTVGESFNPTGLTLTANCSDGSHAYVTDEAEWEADPATFTEAGTTTVVVMGTYCGKSDIQEYTVTVNAAPQFVTWDLTTDNTATATANEISWTSAAVSMIDTKGTSGTTDANSYYGGDSQGRTSTRFYKNSTLAFTPENGITITSIVYEATTAGYATALANSTWTNATASADGTTVTITPTNGAQAVSAIIGGTTGASGVTVYYSGSATPATEYNINLNQNAGGTISASVEKATAGTEITLTATPNTGYVFSEWTVLDGNANEVEVINNKFVMPESDVEVEATFEEKGAPGSYTYNLVTDASTLAAGDVIVLGCAAKGKAAGAMGTGAFFTSVDATISDGVLSSKDVIEITLGGSAGAWTLTTSEGQITTSAAKALKLNNGTQKTWTISISGGTATITGGSYGDIQYNSGSPRFCNYTSSQSAIEIYKKTAAETKTLTSISLENQTTSFTEGDEFAFGGTVTAHYDDESTKDVTTSATFSGYDMSVLDTEQTVTVSYTEGGVTKEASYTITVVSLPRYTVTIETPANGTLVVKHGDDVVTSGAQFAVGEVLDVTATPAAGYKFRNWQAVDGTTHTFTSGTKWTMTASDVTIKANFDPADQKYLISWNVNGTVTNQQVNANSALVAPDMTGKTLGTREFVGWTEDALVKNDTIPTYVTLGTATKDVTYYAVFADREEVTAAVPTSITAYADGNFYIVDAFEVDGTTHYYAMDGSANSAGNIVATDITNAVTLNDNGTITIDETATCMKDAMKYNITLSDGKYLLKNLLTNKYIKKASTKNDLKNNETGIDWTILSSMGGAPRFCLECEGDRGIFLQYAAWNDEVKEVIVSPRFKAYATSNRGKLQANSTNKQQDYSAGYTYFVPATPIALSNFATHEVSVSQYGSTTLCMPEDYVMPEGLTGKIVTANEAVDSKGDGYYTLTFQTKYTAGDIVPAGECLVLSGNQGSYYIAPGETTAKVSDDNLLHGDYVIDTTDSKLRFITTYDEENASSNFYYKLATDKNKENFGWYWGNTTGEPFIMTSNERAYLVIDKGTAGLIRGFALDEFGEEDITTFIEGLTNEEINKSGRIYNLQGQMVNKLQKGINIVNGKKVIR